MEQSILKSTKKILGLADDYVVFDHDVVTHINTAFFTLNQLGIGPTQGFMIEDDTAVWTDFIPGLAGDDPRWSAVKTYVFMRVRIIFDPPATSFLINAMNEQLTQLEWRLSVLREGLEWTDPTIEEV